MKKTLIFLSLFLLVIGAKANDGAFYSRGNQLIPIVETDISVKKEILKINRVLGNFGSSYEVTVNYEFFNPGAAKDLLVGFEANAPSPAYGPENYPDHPSIFDFKVIVNGVELPYQVAHVPFEKDKDGYYSNKIGGYYKNGRFQDMTLEQCEESSYNKEYDYYYDDPTYYYVYHFNAHFNKGLNTIQHTYRFEGSGYVMTEYLFDYVLTAANRWANNGIDDFTLEINMGKMESFAIRPTFFKSANEWTVQGKGKVTMQEVNLYDYGTTGETRPMFHMAEGSVVFHKKNFHPTGELYLSKPNFFYGQEEKDPFKTQYFSLSPWFYEMFLGEVKDPEQRRILKNLPFAYRGYVFKSPELQRYFESTDWYIPNPDYKSSMEGMSQDEKEWIQLFSN